MQRRLGPSPWPRARMPPHLRMRALAAAGAQPKLALSRHYGTLLVGPGSQTGRPQHFYHAQRQLNKGLQRGRGGGIQQAAIEWM